ncbi:hypothetical protein ACFUYE_05380 [Micromonospora humida]|uniref:hypothetical protein n=1 Tax=Micromonospora humida TaxID=2809018 RepID=UPI00366A8E6F
MSTIKDKIRAAGRPEKTVPVCLSGALAAEFEAAERQLQEALRRPATDSLDGGGETRELAEQIEDLRQQMVEGTVEFRLRAMGRKRWRAFIGEHPPRQDDDGEIDARDVNVGVNVDSFYPALIRESTVAPVLDDEDWLDLIGGVRKLDDGTEEEVEGAFTSRQFDELATTAWNLNRDVVSVPFSRAASRILSSAPE